MGNSYGLDPHPAHPSSGTPKTSLRFPDIGIHFLRFGCKTWSSSWDHPPFRSHGKAIWNGNNPNRAGRKLIMVIILPPSSNFEKFTRHCLFLLRSSSELGFVLWMRTMESLCVYIDIYNIYIYGEREREREISQLWGIYIYIHIPGQRIIDHQPWKHWNCWNVDIMYNNSHAACGMIWGPLTHALSTRFFDV